MVDTSLRETLFLSSNLMPIFEHCSLSLAIALVDRVTVAHNVPALVISSIPLGFLSPFLSTLFATIIFDSRGIERQTSNELSIRRPPNAAVT